MVRPPPPVLDFESGARPVLNLRGRRWALVRYRRAPWLVYATVAGPRGVRLRAHRGAPAVFEVGLFTVLVTADDAHLVTLLTEERDAPEDPLRAAWAAAGFPRDVRLPLLFDVHPGDKTDEA